MAAIVAILIVSGIIGILLLAYVFYLIGEGRWLKATAIWVGCGIIGSIISLAVFASTRGEVFQTGH